MTGAALLIIATAAIAYAAIATLVYLRQARLLYQPDAVARTSRLNPGAIGIPYEDLRIPTADGAMLHAWWVPASASRPAVLFCHGNAGTIADRLDTVRLFAQLDLNLLIFDYRGYGESTGRPSEGGTHRDAQAAWRHLVEQRGFGPDRIIVFGRSLGAAVAGHLAGEVGPGALILESPFTSLPDIAAHHFWYLPVRALVQYRYSTLEAVERVESPTLVIHSADDEIVPIEQGREVYDRARGPKRFLLIRGSHNEGFLASGTRYSEGLRRFIDWALEAPQQLPALGAPPDSSSSGPVIS